MKVVHFLAASVLVLCFMSGCGSTGSQVASLASNPMISSLTSATNLGLTPDQAIGGASGLMSIAKGNLSSENFSKVAGAIPASGSIMDTGLKKLGLSTDKVKSLADLSGSVGKMGLNMDQVNQMVPVMTDFMSKGGNQEAADLFKGAIK